MLFEGGKSLSLNNEITDIGVSGALKVMQHLGIRDYTKELKDYKTKTRPMLIEKSSWVRARYSGMYHPLKQTGVFIEKGEVVGSISGPYGDFEKQVKAPHSGYIICTNESAIVNQGDALVHLTHKSNI